MQLYQVNSSTSVALLPNDGGRGILVSDPRALAAAVQTALTHNITVETPDLKWKVLCMVDASAPQETVAWRIYPAGQESLEVADLRTVQELLTAYLTTGTHSGIISPFDARLGWLWLTVAEAAAESQIQPRTIRAACLRGDILEAKLEGGEWIFPAACFDAWQYNLLLRKRGPAGTLKRAIAQALQGLPLRKMVYPGELSSELRPFYCYPVDAGHSILAVPAAFANAANLAQHLVATPVKTVLRGYEMQQGFIVALHARYDETLGLLTPPEDNEY